MGSWCSCLTSVPRPHACFSSEWLTLTKFLAFKAVNTHLISLPVSLKNSPVFQRKVTLQTSFGSVPGFFFQRDHSLMNMQKRQLFPDKNVHCMTELLWLCCVSQALCKAIKEILLYTRWEGSNLGLRSRTSLVEYQRPQAPQMATMAVD